MMRFACSIAAVLFLLTHTSCTSMDDEEYAGVEEPSDVYGITALDCSCEVGNNTEDPSALNAMRDPRDIFWAHLKNGSAYITDCGGTVTLVPSFVSLSRTRADTLTISLNGQLARESDFPAAAMLNLDLEPGRHTLKIALSYEGVMFSRAVVQIRVIRKMCTSGPEFEPTDMVLLSPIHNTVYTSPSCNATVPLELVWTPHFVRGVEKGFMRRIRSVRLTIDGRDMRVIEARRWTMCGLGCGVHTVELVALDAEGDLLGPRDYTEFKVVPTLNGIDKRSYERHVRSPEESQVEFAHADSAVEDPRCLLIVHPNKSEVVYVANGEGVVCTEGRCEEGGYVAEDYTPLDASEASPCHLYLVRLGLCHEWPPTRQSCPQIFAAAHLTTHSIITSSQDDKTYPVRFWEALRNRAGYSHVMGYRMYMYLAPQQHMGLRHPFFTKILAFREAIMQPAVEMVYWMDHDSWFGRGLTDEIPLEHYTSMMQPWENLIFPDLTYEVGPITELCTAFFGVRKSAWTMEFLKLWWDAGESGKFNDQIAIGHAWATMVVREPPHAHYKVPHISECESNSTYCGEAVATMIAEMRKVSASGPATQDLTQEVRMSSSVFLSKNYWPSMMTHHFIQDSIDSVDSLCNSFVVHSGSQNYFDYSVGNAFGYTIPFTTTARSKP